jgi:hypothetical protein
MSAPGSAQPPAPAAAPSTENDSDIAAPSPPKVPRYYSFTNMVDVAKKDGLSADTLSVAADSVLGSNCFRKSYLWGAALGGLFAAHRFKQGGTALRAANDGVLASMATFAAQWYFCREDEVARRAALKAFYAQQQQRSGSRGGAAAGGGVYDDDDDLGAAAAVTDASIDAELRRVTAYELPAVKEGPTTSVQIR